MTTARQRRHILWISLSFSTLLLIMTITTPGGKISPGYENQYPNAEKLIGKDVSSGIDENHDQAIQIKDTTTRASPPIMNALQTTPKVTEPKPPKRQSRPRQHVPKKATGSPVHKPSKSLSYKKLSDLFISRLSRKIESQYSDNLQNFDFTPGEELPVEKIRKVLILSTWRSGSTFMGDLLSSYPGTFYSFEPMHMLLPGQIYQSDTNATTIQELMRDILTCSFQNHHDYLEYLKGWKEFIRYNREFFSICIQNKALCFDPEFVSRACKHLPINLIKTVRLGLAPIKALMEDESLDLHVIQLVRDPRGSLNSRSKIGWCTSDDCINPEVVCDKLLTDLKLSRQFSELFPNRYLLLRYEDLSMNTNHMAQAILKFIGLPKNKNVDKFITDHSSAKPSKRRKQSQYTTFRDSSHVTFAWRNSMSYESMMEIQTVCEKPLRMLGYKLFKDEASYMNTTISVI